MPMGHQLARLCSSWPTDRAELESTAYLALAEAAQSFDSPKVGFGTCQSPLAALWHLHLLRRWLSGQEGLVDTSWTISTRRRSMSMPDSRQES